MHVQPIILEKQKVQDEEKDLKEKDIGSVGQRLKFVEDKGPVWKEIGCAGKGYMTCSCAAISGISV